MRELLAESPVSPDRNLWLVVPDAWPDGLRVVWLVLGKTPDDSHSVTMPIEAGQLPVVVDALSRHEADAVNDLFGHSHYERLTRSAELSDCGRYRYSLRRSWQHGGNGQVVCFLMLNPSASDALADDPTVRRCMAFCRAWGYSTLSVRNLFALRATDPAELLAATDPVGPQGDAHVRSAATADLVVCAWGAKVPFGRDRRALELLAGRQLYCLGLTRAGAPRHPLYVRGDAVPLPYRPEGGPTP